MYMRKKGIRRKVLSAAIVCAMPLGLSAVAMGEQTQTPAPQPAAPAAVERAADTPQVTGPYSRLTLTEEQKANIARIQTAARERMERMHRQERREIEALLTHQQLEQLMQIERPTESAAPAKPSTPQAPAASNAQGTPQAPQAKPAE